MILKLKGPIIQSHINTETKESRWERFIFHPADCKCSGSASDCYKHPETVEVNLPIRDEKRYFQRQLQGLMLILDDSPDPFIHKDYIKEKLQMALGPGINFHPGIKVVLDKMFTEESND